MFLFFQRAEVGNALRRVESNPEEVGVKSGPL